MAVIDTYLFQKDYQSIGLQYVNSSKKLSAKEYIYVFERALGRKVYPQGKDSKVYLSLNLNNDCQRHARGEEETEYGITDIEFNDSWHIYSEYTR